MVPKRLTLRSFALPLIVLGSAALIAAGCGSDDDKDSDNTDTKTPAAETGSPNDAVLPNYDLANTRVASTDIDASNVDTLKVLWKQPVRGAGQFGGFAAFPIVHDGIAYVQDLASNAYAFDLATGEQKWFKEYKAATIGPNGLAYDDGKIYGVTNSDVFSLDAETGEELWKVNILKYEFGIAEGSNLGFTIQPIVHDGVVYLSEAAKAGGGNLLALDAKDGSEKWKFDTFKEEDEAKGASTPSGGAWNPPAIDDEGNVYYNVANGYFSYSSPKATQGDKLYTDSTLKLDAETGKLDWYMQGITNDFYDWDMHLSPILAEADGTDVVISSGKMGIVYSTDRETGKQLWKTPVGTHNGHDDDSQKQLDGTLAPLKAPLTIFPGPYGGVETNMAVDGDTIYAAVVDLPAEPKTAKDLASPVMPVDFAKGKGHMVALDIVTGKIKWDTELDQMPFGAATVANDLVFTTTFDGKVRAYNTSDGTEAWTGDLGTPSNSPLTIAGDYLITAGAFPQGKGQKANFVVFKLGATEEITPPAASEDAGADDSKAGTDAAAGAEDAVDDAVIEVGVEEGELKFDTEQLSARAGKVTFRFTNPDSIAHDFRIEQDGEDLGGTKIISNGDSEEFTIDLQAGDYDFYCSPHKQAGMTGKLTVT